MSSSYSLIYAAIAKDQEILVQHTDQQGNFQNVAKQIVAQVTRKQKISFKHHLLKFHTFHDGELLYLCITDDQYQKRIAYKFLDSIRETFCEIPQEYRSIDNKSALNKAYKRILVQQYDLFNTNRCDKTLQVKDEIESLKTTLLSNLDKAMANGEKLEALNEKTKIQVKLSTELKKSAKELKKTLWWQKYKLWFLIVLVVLFVVYLFSIYLCRGFWFNHCIDPGLPFVSRTTVNNTNNNSVSVNEKSNSKNVENNKKSNSNKLNSQEQDIVIDQSEAFQIDEIQIMENQDQEGYKITNNSHKQQKETNIESIINNQGLETEIQQYQQQKITNNEDQEINSEKEVNQQEQQNKKFLEKNEKESKISIIVKKIQQFFEQLLKLLNLA